MKLICIIFAALVSYVSLHGAVDDVTTEALIRRVTLAERASFYEQLDRTSHALHGSIAREALEPIFQVIASGDITAITSIPDESFNAFAANYMVARHIFKNSFNILGILSLSMHMKQPKHDITANLPVNKMDDMLIWAQFVRCDQIVDSKQRMIQQMSFIQFATVTDGAKKRLVPTNQLKLPHTLVNSILSLYGKSPKELPETRYYQERTSGGVSYRMFSVTSDRVGHPLPDHPIFSSVFFGDVKVLGSDKWTLEDTRDEDHLTNPRAPGFYHYNTPTIKNGALFRKDGTLLEKNGIVIVPREPFSHCYLVLSYYKNAEFDQMCFEEHAVITKQSIDIPGIAFLINAFGGFETIDEQRIGFIESVNEEPPHHAEAEVRAGAGAEPSSSTQSISIAQARMLLPYLYLLEDSQSVETEEETNDEINFAQTRAAINLVESVLSETGVDESDGSMEEDEENISFDTIESTHVLTVPAVSAAVTAAAPTTSKKNYLKRRSACYSTS